MTNEQLEKVIKRLKIILHESQIFCEKILNDPEQKNHEELVTQALLLVNQVREYLDSTEITFKNMRKFLDNKYYKLLNIMKELFVNMIILSDTNFLSMEKWSERNATTLFFANYIILNQNYRILKDHISQHFIQSYKSSYQLVVDENSPLWDLTDTNFIELNTDITQIRNYSQMIVRNVKFINKDFSLTILEEQVSEIIKNAVKHGNKLQKEKKVKLWYLVNNKFFKIIVEDEGEGFQNLDDWNECNKKRNEALKKGNMEEMLKYIQYKGPNSQDDDGGNSLFAAIEYWDSGLVYNSKRNKVVAVKYLYD